MITISLTECIIIGLITILCGFIIEYFIRIYSCKEINNDNLFTYNKKNIMFLISLFVIGILIHIGLTFIEFDQWTCAKVCDLNGCKVLCSLPLNSFTNLLITE